MKRGFTLLELIVVIIIIGVLATLGFQQYGKMIEKSRGAEAKAVMGTIRTLAAAYRMENNNTLTPPAPAVTFGNAQAGIGSGIPAVCATTHYFSYNIQAGTTADQVTIRATRCLASGKNPQGTAVGGAAPNLDLITNLASGVDSWVGTGGY